MKAPTLCRSCGEKFANRPRGLCWHCWHLPDSRQRFPSQSKFARRGVKDDYSRSHVPLDSTSAAPGSEAKILVLMDRAAHHERMDHPDDGPADPESATMNVAGVRTEHGERRLHCVIPAYETRRMTEGVGGSRGEEKRCSTLDFAREGG